MASLDDFLTAHPEIPQGSSTGPVRPTDQASITVTVLVLEVNDEQVVFAHFGKCFLVARADVQDVSATSAAIPNPFGKGMPATLTLHANAQVVVQQTLPAESLLRGLPFAVARPSLGSRIERRTSRHTRQEQSFFAARNMPVGPSGEIGTSFGTVTMSYDDIAELSWSDDSAWDSTIDQ